LPALHLWSGWSLLRSMAPVASNMSLLKRVPLKWWGIVGYLCLLVLSATFPFFQSVERYSKDYPSLVPAYDFKNDKVAPTGEKIFVHANLYGFNPEGGSGGKPVVVYLHRLPWTKQGSEFCKELAKSGKVAVVEPFMPGFATSPGDVPSHSMEANAHVVAALLEQYGIHQYHVIAHGLSSVAALELVSAYDTRIQSVTFLSAPGVQEFELLGNPLVNKIVYGFHGAFFWGVSRLTPNFGLVDLLPWDRDYAKTIFDTDLTDSNKILHGMRHPLLLVHGDSDWLTPLDSAIYTSKILPHSELVVLSGGRDVVFQQKKKVADKVIQFVSTPNAVAIGHSQNPPIPRAQGYHYWILLIIIILCTFVAEDPTCLASGLMVAVGILDFWSVTVACFIGIFIGDVFLYSIGRYFGRPALRKAPLKWFIKEHKVNQWSGWFSTPKGMLVVVSSRFVPASRVPTFITAGIMKLNFANLGLLLMVAALIWTPPLIWIGYQFGESGMQVLHKFKSNALWVIIGFLVALHFITHWIVPTLTWRGRRQIIMKVRNYLQPSLWPSWLLFLPVRIGVIFLSLRHRSLTAFASANPSFGRIGGFMGDAKSLLLRPFQRDSRCVPFVGLAMEDASEVRMQEAKAFAACHGYPLVLKPEVSCNGAGLRYVRNSEQLTRWLSVMKEDMILQKFIPGLEFEVVWSRSPGKDNGHIMALVHKQEVVVTGDGEQTLEELIWLDDFAVSRAELYLQGHDRELTRVVPAGQKVILNLSGSYGHGVRCQHRPELITPEFSAAITAFAKRFPALHYARLDVRVTQESHLKTGQFVITEVDGCCSVSSLLRDGSLLFRRSYRAIWEQLGVCIEAGAHNLKQKVRPVPIDELLARWSQAQGRTDEFAITED
ncbi:hypothetical protein EBR11_02590, partial [bacterium]|nr:hypothetical protein [bacterium]